MSREFWAMLWAFLVVTFIIMNMIDCYITNYAVEKGLAMELNPLKVCGSYENFFGFLQTKLFIGLFISLVIVLLTLAGMDQAYGTAALILLNLIYAIVALINVYKFKP